jgi:hypothetical protein
MTFGYNANSGALRKKTLLVAMGVVAIPLSFHIHDSAPVAPAQPKIPTSPRDARVTRLHGFLSKLACPVASMADDFVRAADENHLDWRLLPSIAVIESGGGKAYKNNNIFGWNKGEQSFASIRSGLELVAYKLGHSPLYRRRDSLGKLRIYNEDEDYAGAVMAVMNRISPRVRVQPVIFESQYWRNAQNFQEVRY